MGPQIAMDGPGSFVIAWSENTNNDNFREK